MCIKTLIITVLTHELTEENELKVTGMKVGYSMRMTV